MKHLHGMAAGQACKPDALPSPYGSWGWATGEVDCDQNTWFYDKLCQAHRNGDDCYSPDKAYWQYQHKGHSLATGSTDQLGSLINIEHKHWVAAVVEVTVDVIWYGDLLNKGISESTKDVLGWWTRFNTGWAFTFKEMSISLQVDWFLCCLLPCNGLEVFFLPRKHWLMDPRKVAEGCLAIPFRVIQHHRSQPTEVSIPYHPLHVSDRLMKVWGYWKWPRRVRSLRWQTNFPPTFQTMSWILAPWMRTIYTLMRSHCKTCLWKSKPHKMKVIKEIQEGLWTPGGRKWTVSA